MLDPVIDFFKSLFRWIGIAFGKLISWLFWPFVAFRTWLRGRGWFIKIPVFVILAAIVVSYIYLIYITQFWTIRDASHVAKYSIENLENGAGERLASGQCQPSAMVAASADIINANVNEGPWVPSNPFFKAGLFLVWDWRETPFFDNRAAFQLGTNQVVRRTAVELVDRLGRVRGTSAINQNLQQGREAANYRENAWILTFSPPFLQPSTQARLRDARQKLLDFNTELSACNADFDTRADNLLQFMDRVTADIGSTSDILQRRMQEASAIGFDRRADDRFWFAYGQLYAYHAILTAMRSDFRIVFEQRNLGNLWDRIDGQLNDVLKTQPFVVANGSASSLIKSHLESIGFDLLRVRSNLVEMRDVLDR
ncbi:MAG: DUF2333 family protein [Pseudomonadota bacterium]